MVQRRIVASADGRSLMIEAREIIDLVQSHVKRLLDLAELAIPADKFPRFRTLVLDEFGHEGFRKELTTLLDQGGLSGKDGKGTGRIDSGRKGGAP